MRLSPRLKAILSSVEGRVLADIGTDHGYVPIIACLEKRVERAVACDACPGPLARAQENIVSAGLENRIETRLGFGLRPLKYGEVDCVVISGMGGMNIIEILKDPAVKLPIKRLIVQPQRDIFLVKDTLADMGFEIVSETEVKDRGRTYSIITSESLYKSEV